MAALTVYRASFGHVFELLAILFVDNVEAGAVRFLFGNVTLVQRRGEEPTSLESGILATYASYFFSSGR
jgi:hypothetical protein